MVPSPIMFEQDIRKSQKMDTVSIISNMRLTTFDLGRMKIPLSRLVRMPMVRPTLFYDLKLLENQFSHGYKEGACIFYVSIADEDGKTSLFSDAERQEWGRLWNLVNDQFNVHLRLHNVLKHLVDQKFYICDENHRRIAWMNFIKKMCFHSRETGTSLWILLYWTREDRLISLCKPCITLTSNHSSCISIYILASLLHLFSCGYLQIHYFLLEF